MSDAAKLCMDLRIVNCRILGLSILRLPELNNIQYSINIHSIVNRQSSIENIQSTIINIQSTIIQSKIYNHSIINRKSSITQSCIRIQSFNQHSSIIQSAITNHAIIRSSISPAVGRLVICNCVIITPFSLCEMPNNNDLHLEPCNLYPLINILVKI